ncbi:MAG: LysE family transporter [Chloroflexota bacterium]|nr:LysE family transporter [Chloroflexota bacterium]
MIELLSRAIGYGVTATILPGPIQTYIINSALAHGWRKSIALVATPLIADIPIMFVVIFVLTSLREFPPELLSAIRIVSGIVILYVAWGAFRAWQQGATMGGNVATGDASTSSRAILRQGIVMNILSPGPYIFWPTLHGPLVIDALKQSPAVAALYIAAFYLTFGIGIALIVFAFDRLRMLDPRITRGLILFSALLLALFGILTLAQGISEALALFQIAQGVVHY